MILYIVAVPGGRGCFCYIYIYDKRWLKSKLYM